VSDFAFDMPSLQRLRAGHDSALVEKIISGMRLIELKRAEIEALIDHVREDEEELIRLIVT
jgi:hypothetical protein